MNGYRSTTTRDRAIGILPSVQEIARSYVQTTSENRSKEAASLGSTIPGSTVKKNSTSGSRIVRVSLGFMLCSVSAVIAVLGFGASSPRHSIPPATSIPSSPPTFGHPVISGIGGNGYEADLRLDPTDPNRVYTSSPGALDTNTSWIWRSVDGGKTFKWVPGAAPFQGKVTTCQGGADTELAVDSGGHLYFNDLTFANFSTARSDDGGTTFTCVDSGVPDAVLDRQWYSVDGDPTNGGNLYLTGNENGPGGTSCDGSGAPNNVFVMYRSPVAGDPLTAGIQFGPANKITPILGCDAGLPGNNEISPIATTLGQPDGSGGFATLSTPVKHVYAIHDDANHHQVRIARCFPVAFGQPVPNVSDPSGLNCTDVLVAELGTSGVKTGGTFLTMAIDKAGNLYAVWEQAPVNASGQVIGDTVLRYSHSTDQGNTWAAPIEIETSGSPIGTLHNNVFAWIAAGDDRKIDIAWYGTPGTAPVPSFGPDSCACDWSLWLVQSLNAHDAQPVFTPPVLASEHFIHRGSILTFGIGGQHGDRRLGDFLQLRIGHFGEAQISYADSNHLAASVVAHAMYVRQNGGNGLYAAASPVNIAGIAPFNSVSDETGDANYEANGSISASMPNLDIISSSISKITSTPCSTSAPCYQVAMQLNNLSLTPDVANDPDLVWLTQWMVPSTTDPNGGKNFFVYAESTGGGAVQCFADENHAMRDGDWFVFTYPGTTPLPAANCVTAPGPNGTITIDVPISMVSEVDPIDDRLHEVTASTMTLAVPANSEPAVGTYYGVQFNMIDVAQPYIFNPNPGPVQLVSAVSRKVHGSAGTFDIGLGAQDPPPPGSLGIECRSGGANGDYTLVFTFANPLTNVAGASVTSGTGTVSSSAIGSDNHDYVVNLTGVTNTQVLTVSLVTVSDAAGHASASVPISMGVLLADVNASHRVDAADVSLVRQQTLQPVTATNFREDINTSGRIDAADVSIARQQTLTSLP